jgi:hypothetical protein
MNFMLLISGKKSSNKIIDPRNITGAAVDFMIHFQKCFIISKNLITTQNSNFFIDRKWKSISEPRENFSAARGTYIQRNTGQRKEMYSHSHKDSLYSESG